MPTSAHARKADELVLAGDVAHRMAQPVSAIAMAVELAEVALGRADFIDLARRISVIQQEVDKLRVICIHLSDLAKGSHGNGPPVAP